MKKFFAIVLVAILGACSAFEPRPVPTDTFVPGERVEAPYGCVELRKREGKDAC